MWIFSGSLSCVLRFRSKLGSSTGSRFAGFSLVVFSIEVSSSFWLSCVLFLVVAVFVVFCWVEVSVVSCVGSSFGTILGLCFGMIGASVNSLLVSFSVSVFVFSGVVISEFVCAELSVVWVAVSCAAQSVGISMAITASVMNVFFILGV